MIKSDSHRKKERLYLRILKGVLSIVIIAAVVAGIFLYVNSQGTGTGTGVAPDAYGYAVVINEFLTSNSAVLPDETGEYSDWIEIYNASGENVDLSGYGLSDESKSAKWQFPGITLKPGEYIVVFASDKNVSDKNAVYQHTNFKLSSSGGGVYLFGPDDKIADKVEYDAQTENISLGRSSDSSQFAAYDKPTPGFPNTEEGYASFVNSRIREGSQLIITEINPLNTTTFVDNSGSASDYIELYNGSAEAINLSGYGLSDDAVKVMKWKFPEVTIGPGEYLVVFASGEDESLTDVASKAIHTNFRVSTYNETITLCDAAGYILDRVSIKEIPPRTAYVRKIDGDGAYTAEWELTTAPSPGARNGGV